jgi:hypothetical protein
MTLTSTPRYVGQRAESCDNVCGKVGKTCALDGMRSYARNRFTDPKDIESLGVNGLEHGDCTALQNSGATTVIPFVYPPGDCRLFPDRPEQTADITCDAKPVTGVNGNTDPLLDPVRICACAKRGDGGGQGGHRRLDGAGRNARYRRWLDTRQKSKTLEVSVAPELAAAEVPRRALQMFGGGGAGGSVFGNLDESNCPWDTVRAREGPALLLACSIAHTRSMVFSCLRGRGERLTALCGGLCLAWVVQRARRGDECGLLQGRGLRGQRAAGALWLGLRRRLQLGPS